MYQPPFKASPFKAAALCLALALPLLVSAQPPPKAKPKPAVQATSARTQAIKDATATDPAKKQSAPADLPTAGKAPATGGTPANSARDSALTDLNRSPGQARSAADGKDALTAAEGALGDRAAARKGLTTIDSSITQAPAFNQGFSDRSGVNLQGVVGGGNPLAPARDPNGAPAASSAVNSGLVSDQVSGSTTSATGAKTGDDGNVSSSGKASDAGQKLVGTLTGSGRAIVDTQTSSDGRNRVETDINGTKHVYVDGKPVGKIYSGGTVEPTGSSCPPDLDSCNQGDREAYLKKVQADVNFQIKQAAKEGGATTPNPTESGFAVAPGTAVPSRTQTGQNLFGNPGTAAANTGVGSSGGGGGLGATSSRGIGVINPGPEGSSPQGSGRTDDPGAFFDQAGTGGQGLGSRPASGASSECDADQRTATTSDDCPT